MNEHILQIVSAAPGWRAVFWPTSEEDGALYEQSIACFALIESEDRTSRSVIPIMPSDGSAYLYDDPDYKALLGPGETIADLGELVPERFRRIA
jgi:hypothetical protein